MATRHSARQTAGRRRAAGSRATHALGRFGYRRSLRFEPLEDRRLLAVVTVDTDQDVVDFNDGVLSLREAIFATNTVPGPDTIEFAPSLTAGGPATILLTQGELAITDDLTIQGPGASLLKIDASEYVPMPGLIGDYGSRVFLVRSPGLLTPISVELIGVTLTGGDTELRGGGLYASHSHLELVDCTITGNSSRGGGGMFVRYSDLTMIGGAVSDNESRGGTVTSRGGGGIGIASSDVTLAGVEVSGNTAAILGGGIVQRGGTLTILNSVISGNVAGLNEFSNSVGGGIASGRRSSLEGQSLIVRNSQIIGNTSGGSGGGIYIGGLRSTPVDISGATISDNMSGGDGGGILTFSADTTISDSIVARNSAAGVGGGIASIELILQVAGNVSAQATNATEVAGTIPDDYGLFITRSTVSDNSAGGSGGGVYTLNQSVAIVASTVHGNASGETGGGLAVFKRSPVPAQIILLNSTVSGNLSDGDGGGLYLIGLASDTHTLANTTITENGSQGHGGGVFLARGALQVDHSIVAENGAVLGPDLTGLLDTEINARYSLIGDNSGTGLTPAPVGSPDENGNLIGGSTRFTRIDPELEPLADNGGPTMTHALMYGLVAESPAIDAGDPDALPGEEGVPVFDQRGEPFTRVYGGRIDMGAFESQPPGVLLGDYNQDGTIDAADYTVWRDEMSSLGAGGETSASSVEPSELYADGNGDGVINDWDYQLWRNNFGSVLADVEASSGSGAVAPPSAVVIEKVVPLPETQVVSVTPPSGDPVIAQGGQSPFSAVREQGMKADAKIGTVPKHPRQDQLLSTWVASRTRRDDRWESDDLLARGRRQAAEDANDAHASAVDRLFGQMGRHEAAPFAGLRSRGP